MRCREARLLSKRKSTSYPSRSLLFAGKFPYRGSHSCFRFSCPIRSTYTARLQCNLISFVLSFVGHGLKVMAVLYWELSWANTSPWPKNCTPLILRQSPSKVEETSRQTVLSASKLVNLLPPSDWM